MKINYFFDKSQKLQKLTFATNKHKYAVILLFAGVATTLLLITHAATPYISIEAESGTPNTATVVPGDTTASGGSYVLFSSSQLTLSITAPAAGTTVTGTMNLSAVYAGNVQNVEFYNGANKIASGTLSNGTATATVDTTTIPNGPLTITAKAWDAPAGNPNFTKTVTGAGVTVTVQNVVVIGPVGAGNGGTTAPRLPVVNVRDFGAKGDGSTDDTGAIAAAIASTTLSNGGTVYFPAGTYRQTTDISIDVANIALWSDTASAVINTTEVDGHNIAINGAGSGIYGLSLTSDFRNFRNLPDHHGRYRIFVNAPNVTIRGITLDGSALMGIVMRAGSDHVTIENNIVANTGADAIHNTGGTHDNIIRNNTINHAGDDCVAVVSPGGQPVVYNILVENNRCNDGWMARGYSVIGGEYITIQNNEINGVNAAGIIVAHEASFPGPASKHIKILNNYIRGAVNLSNPNVQPANHASIFIHGESGFEAEDILIAGNIIDGDSQGGISATIYVETANNIAVNIIGNTITGSRRAINVDAMGSNTSQFNLKNNTQNGNALPNQINNPGIIPAGY